MKTSTPIRIDRELLAAAKCVAPTMSRSATQQIVHWARIGKEIEASPQVSIGRIAEVLRGGESYDALESEEQAVVRAYWSERMAGLRDTLRLDQDFAAAKLPYVELAEDGTVVRRDPVGDPQPVGSRRRGEARTSARISPERRDSW